MTETYLSVPLQGQKLRECSPDQLVVPKTQDMIRAFSGTINWVCLVKLYQHLSTIDGGEQVVAETIVFDAEIELPQICVYEIERIERIAVTFRPEDKNSPKVYALRKNFPDVLHINLESFELPRSLCVFEEDYAELKLRWTAVGFIETIRRWLADTATGTLHRIDQPVETLLLGTNTHLVLPSKAFSAEDFGSLTKLNVSFNRLDNKFFFIAKEESNENISQEGISFSFVSILGSPQQQSKLRKAPDNLAELDDFLKTAQINLLEQLRAEVKKLNRDEKTLKSGLIVMITLPITRTSGGDIEALEVRAFLCVEDSGIFSTVRKIGEEIGVWNRSDGQIGDLIFFDETKNGEEIKLLMLNPCSTLSRANAPLFTGSKKRFTDKITAVGQGALGSQVFLNMIRSADGEWVLIDKDILMPHNFVRHGAYGAAVGFPKTEIMAHIANTTIEPPYIAKVITADVLDPRNQAEAVKDSLSEAQIILDCSASVAVARHLGLDIKSQARRISLFLNPTGTDLVLLAEDNKRNIPLDSLEMQYYRLLIEDEDLHDHLRPPMGKVRYAAGCRELSNQISPDTVALCAATGSQSLRQVIWQEDAVISLWRVSNDGQVRKYSSNPTACITEKINGWIVRTDEFLLKKLRQNRKGKLPVETGGTLIGSYDMQRKIIYVVDTLPPPADSLEERTSFIRGSYGLKPLVDEIKQISMENLQNIGEWHSHPPGYSTNRSEDDKKLLKSIGKDLEQDGKPALMLIVGENDVSWFISYEE
jgi:integrative and conjugative element protein (TIGR02256 family)